jgi:hypothetical protein
MKRILFLLFIFLFVQSSQSQNKEEKYYVSTLGNDSWSGKLEIPNNTKTDGPFRTIIKAQEEVRKIKNTTQANSIAIIFRSGEYEIQKTIEFNEADGGKDNTFISYKAYPNEKVTFIGAKKIIGFEKIKDKSILARLDKKVQNKVYELDLKKLGITDYGQLKHQGFGNNPRKPLQMELFFNGKTMLLAQYPNKDWLTITDVPQKGDLKDAGDTKFMRGGVPVGRHYGYFAYNDEHPAKWQTSNDIWMHGYWAWDWADAYEKAADIDKLGKTVKLDTPYFHQGYIKGQRFRFINVFEEIDMPGEYYIDRTTGKLYFYPPDNIEKGEAYVSTLNDMMLTFDNCSNVSFEKIKFQYSRSGAVKIKDGNNIKFSGCTFSCLGLDAVTIDGGKNNGLVSCDMYDLAAGGVYIVAGDRKTLIPAGNYVENCDIHNFGTIWRTYTPAISLYGVGNRASHNHIYDAPHMGIYFIGNDHTIEYNEIDHVALETGDVGAIYTGRDYTSRGTVVRYNYLHDLLGPGLIGVMGVYLDDFTTGITITGNIFYKSGHAVMVGGGRENIIENNIFIECAPSVFVDARGTYMGRDCFSGKNGVLWQNVRMYNIKEPPYSIKYPQMVNIQEDEPWLPKYNKILNNVSFGGRFIDLYSGLDYNILTVKNNLIADTSILRRSERGDSESEKFVDYNINDQEIVYKFSLGNNTVIKEDPGFENFKAKDFRLKKDSKAFELGFKEIPISKIGIYKDEFRK